MKVCFQDRPGFTMLEIIVVLVLMAILSLSALARLSQTNAEVLGDRDRLMAHIRYAQSRALRTSSTWTIDFTGASSYQILQDGAARFLPGLETPTITIASSITTGGDVSFNSWGEPSVGGTPLAATSSISLSDGTYSAAITIEPDTGYVHD